jgi:hypothetical protein
MSSAPFWFKVKEIVYQDKEDVKRKLLITKIGTSSGVDYPHWEGRQRVLR